MTIEKTRNEARQGETKTGTSRRVLVMSLALAVICLAAALYIFG